MRGSVDLDEDDVGIDRCGIGGPPHPPVVQLQLSCFQESAGPEREDDGSGAEPEEQSGEHLPHGRSLHDDEGCESPRVMLRPHSLPPLIRS